MAELIAEHVETAQAQADAERLERERPATLREIADDWLRWLIEVRQISQSTLNDYRSTLADPGVTHKRGRGKTNGYVMAAFGTRPAVSITRREISDFLRELDKTEMTPRTVNKHRQVLHALFNYAMRDDTFSLPANPVVGTDKRREPPAAALDFFEPDEIELLAETTASGQHRAPRVGRGGHVMNLSDDEIAMRCEEDAQDAEMIRVLAYTGMRVGECVAIQWGDVDFDHRRLIVQRAVAGKTIGHTKSWQVRYIPLATPAFDALERLRAREDFVQREDFVFVNRYGGFLDSSAFRRRYDAARKTAGLRKIKLHGLRHGAGSLIARESDAVFVQHFLGHSKLATTERYMHAKARMEDVEKLDRAFGVVARADPAGT